MNTSSLFDFNKTRQGPKLEIIVEFSIHFHKTNTRIFPLLVILLTNKQLNSTRLVSATWQNGLDFITIKYFQKT